MFMSDMSLNENLSSTPQDRRELMDLVERMQGAFTTIAKSKIPTIALAHGFCIGGATSLVSACDIRLGAFEFRARNVCIFSRVFYLCRNLSRIQNPWQRPLL